MITDNNTFFDQPPTNKRNWIDNLVLINFIIFVFFSFFGTGLPFQEKSMVAWAEESSNLFNQILYALLFLFTLPPIIFRSEKLIEFIRREKTLSTFIFFCLISFIWSDYALISLKRSFQLVVMYLVMLNTFLSLEIRIIIKVIKINVIIYLLLTFLAGLFITQAIDPSFNTWRGLTEQKNGLGQISMYIFLFSFLFYDQKDELKKKIVNYSISSAAIMLIFLSGSSTVALAFLFILFASVIFYFDKVFHPIGIGRVVSYALLLLMMLMVIPITLFSTELLSFIPALFGKDLTFTGRVYIWDYVIGEILKQPLLGYGYQTYWIMGQRMSTFIINQAHNSYLEIILWVGFIGFSIFLSVIIKYFYLAIKLNANIFILSLAVILIISFSEGILMQARTVTTFSFLFFYIFLSIKYYSSNKLNHSVY